jgi:Sugar kinases, ribokinase family
MNKKKILCFGEMLWDKISATDKRPGGAPMNVGFHLQKHEHEVYVVSRIGDDEDGTDLLKFIEPAGLTADYIQVDPSIPTGVVNVLLDEKQNATYDIAFPSAWDFIQLDEKLIKKAQEVDAIVYGSLAARHEISRNTLCYLLKTKATKIFDVNLRAPHYSQDLVEDLMLFADIIKLNHEEMEIIASWHGEQGKNLETQMRWLGETFSCATVCVTRAENGAAMLHNGIFTEHPGFQVPVENTIGSGDAFLASFVSGIFNDKDPAQIVSDACALGAHVATFKGANPEYNIDEIKCMSTF